MDLIWDGLREAARLWAQGDAEVIAITLRTLAISAAATALALALGVPFGALLALRRFPGRGLLVAAVNTGLGMPPVVVGLVIVLFLWRSGPLGALNLIYTPYAMVAAQFLLALPLVIGFSLTAIQALPTKLLEQMRALGANRAQMLWLIMRETRLGVLAAVMAGFGAAISEVGASMQVGGNLAGETRVLTTATVLETSRGNFELAIALSLILVVMAYLVNLALTTLQQRRTV